MDKHRRHIVFKSPRPLLSKKFGRAETENVHSSAENSEIGEHVVSLDQDGGVVGEISDAPRKSNYPRAYIQIFMMTVGAGVFALPKSIEPLNNIHQGILLTIVASFVVLFTHYAILRAAHVPNKEDILPKDDYHYDVPDGVQDELQNERRNIQLRKRDMFVLIVEERLDCCGGFFKYFFSVARWIVLLICSIAYVNMLKTYLDKWTNWDLETKLQSASGWDSIEPIVFENDSHNPIWWLIVLLFLCFVLATISAKVGKNAQNIREGKYSQRTKNLAICFDIFRSWVSIGASLATIGAVFGTVGIFLTKIKWDNPLGYDQETYSPDYVPQEGQDGYYELLIYFGSVLPVLCISFLNHIGAADVLYENIIIRKTSMKWILDKAGYNFSGSRCCGFRKSRMFVILILQFVFMFIYIIVPVVALLGSGGLVEDNVLVGMKDGGATVLQGLSGVGVLVPLCFQYAPMLVEPAVESLVEPALKFLGWLHCCKDPAHSNYCKEGLRIFITLLAFFIFFIAAVFCPGNLNFYIGLAGSLSGSLIMFVYPALVHLATLIDEAKDEAKDEAGDEQGICSILITGFGKSWSSYDLTSALCSLLTIVFGFCILVCGTLWSFHIGLVDIKTLQSPIDNITQDAIY
jgi:hypothetical protein